MTGKPICGEPRRFLQGVWLIEQMSGAGDDRPVFFSPEFFPSLSIEVDDHIIQTADDQQCRRLDFAQGRQGQIRSTAAGYHRANRLAEACRCLRSRGRTGARAKITDVERFDPQQEDIMEACELPGVGLRFHCARARRQIRNELQC